MNKIKLAIDSGWAGAIAVSYKNQVWTVNSGETYKDIFDDVKQIKNLADDEGYTIDCLLEQVHGMPGQNVKATWSQCENYTAYQVILTCLGISYKLITPKSWQKLFVGVPSASTNKDMDKKEANSLKSKAKAERKKYFKERMQMLYPSLKVTLDNADALAILSVFDKL